jgi:hypothetical protein
VKKQFETSSLANRRNFLLGATVGTVGAVAAAVAGTVKEAAPVSATATVDAKSKGYHMTAHIQQYYDTTRTM